jgi:monothiol glutaredoxin
MNPELEVAPFEVEESLRRGGIRLIDVRSPDEHAVARIEGSRLLDETLAREMLTWPKDTPVVFYCHHGVRSLHTALHLARQGFTWVKSMTGGIDAWSISIDARVPRY